MNYFLSYILGIVFLLAAFVFLFVISELYVAVRKRLNTPQIGVEILLKLLERNDFVCIDGTVRQFSHFARANQTLSPLSPPSESNITIGGEIAFVNNHGLGYVYYYPSIMKNCDFIVGKYGIKWARNTEIAKPPKKR